MFTQNRFNENYYGNRAIQTSTRFLAHSTIGDVNAGLETNGLAGRVIWKEAMWLYS